MLDLPFSISKILQYL